MDSRERFEEYYKQGHPNVGDTFLQYDNGFYTYGIVQGKWKIWQAAWQAQQQTIDDLQAEINDLYDAMKD